MYCYSLRPGRFRQVLQSTSSSICYGDAFASECEAHYIARSTSLGFLRNLLNLFPHYLDKKIQSKKNDKHIHHQCGIENVADIAAPKSRTERQRQLYCTQSMKYHDTVCTHTVDLNATNKDIHSTLHTPHSTRVYLKTCYIYTDEHTLSLHWHSTYKHAHNLHCTKWLDAEALYNILAEV